MGKYEMDAWYFAPYPDEYGKVSTLYVCEYCLKYMKYPRTVSRHKVCRPRGYASQHLLNEPVTCGFAESVHGPPSARARDLPGRLCVGV